MQLQPDIIIAKLSQSVSRRYLSQPKSSSEFSQNTAAKLHAGAISEKASQSLTIPCQWSWCFPHVFGIFNYQKRQRRISRKGQLGDQSKVEEQVLTMVSYRSPAWLIDKAWSLQILRASSGWTFKPRTYNMVSNKSLIFDYARQGDVNSLQELFSNRKASPFDCSDYGWTALHVRDPNAETCHC